MIAPRSTTWLSPGVAVPPWDRPHPPWLFYHFPLPAMHMHPIFPGLTLLPACSLGKHLKNVILLALSGFGTRVQSADLIWNLPCRIFFKTWG